MGLSIEMWSDMNRILDLIWADMLYLDGESEFQLSAYFFRETIFNYNNHFIPYSCLYLIFTHLLIHLSHHCYIYCIVMLCFL